MQQRDCFLHERGKSSKGLGHGVLYNIQINKYDFCESQCGIKRVFLLYPEESSSKVTWFLGFRCTVVECF